MQTQLKYKYAITSLDFLFNGIPGNQKDCDIPSGAKLHGNTATNGTVNSNNSNNNANGPFGQLHSPTTNISDNSTSNGGAGAGGTRLHVSSSLCDSHNMHQDQVNITQFQ